MKEAPYSKAVNAQSVERYFLSSSGDAETGNLPKIAGPIESVMSSEIAFPPGYYATLEEDDEVVVLNPFKDGSQKVIIGVVPDFTFGFKPGARMIYTDNCQVIVTKEGQVIINGTKDIKISNGNGTILINENGVIDLN